jgi:F0F1-type ATP synthase delta subunit
MPEFNMIVPMVEKQPEVKVYTNTTPEEKKQQRIRKKLAKNAEAEIRKETLPD